MPIGEFILNVTGVGDNNHIGCNATANITIIKASSKLVVDNLTVVYAPGNITVWYDVINATVDSFRVYDEYGNPVSCTIVKHKYTFDITGLTAGNYTFNVTADGGINYENATSLSTITIIPADSKVIVPVVVITYGEHAILNVTGENITGISSISILDSNGHVVGNYTINNFTVELWNLNSSSASYRVNVTASVDENHTISSGIGLVFVKKAGSAIIVPDNFNITYGDVKTINIELSDVATGEDGKVVVDPGEEFAYICISLEKGSIEKIKTRLDIEGNGIFPTEQGFTSMYDLRWNKLQTENINYIYNTFTEGKTSIGRTQKTRDMYIYLSTDNKGNEFLYLFG